MNATGVLGHTANSWLAKLPPCLSLSAANKQIVPRIAIQDCAVLHSCSRAEAAPATAATAAAAAIPEQQQQHTVEDAVTSRARLYALYEYVHSNNRLPGLADSHQGVAVGQWAEKCRLQAQMMQQPLDPDLAAALQSIPGWDWTPQTFSLSDSFQASLQQLSAYAQRYGPPPLRGHFKTKGARGPSMAELQQAVLISKKLVEQRKRGVLTQQQIDTVSRTVPGWKWDPRFRAPPLDEVISLLQAHQQQHGRLPTADTRLADGFLLGEWCAARRGEARRGELEVDVAAALETQVPGWEWNRLENVFEKNLKALLGFVRAHGRTPTQREAWGGVRVGAWCNKRRLQYKAGMLPADRAAALEAVPGWWWSCDQMPEVLLQEGVDDGS